MLNPNDKNILVAIPLMNEFENISTLMAVSYTHLDVYKRQVLLVLMLHTMHLMICIYRLYLAA